MKLASAYGLPNGTFFSLEDFNYRSDALTNVTFGHLSNPGFNGITVSNGYRYIAFTELIMCLDSFIICIMHTIMQGAVSFDENGIRTTSHPSVYQFRTGKSVLLIILSIRIIIAMGCRNLKLPKPITIIETEVHNYSH